MQQAGTQKWLRCVRLPSGCGERRAPAWSQDGGQGENHKVKIEAAGARTCPAQIKDGQGLSTQQSATMTDGGLRQAFEDLSSRVFTAIGVLRSVKRSEPMHRWKNKGNHAIKSAK